MIRFLLLFLFAATANGATYYIANNGDDSNSGTSTGSPWETLAEIGRRGLSPGDTVRLNRGDVWRETLPIPDSGNSGDPITYDAYGSGDLPQVNGGTVLSGWSNVSGTRWEASNSISIRYLYVNEQLQAQSRWPDAGYSTYQDYTNCRNITDSSLPNENFIGSRICIKNRNYWIVCEPITDQSGDELRFQNGLSTFSCDLGDSNRYYIENDITQLNAIGEWHDSGSDVFLHWGRDPDLEQSVVATISGQNAVDVSNRDYITINNIAFHYWGNDAFDLASVRHWIWDNVEIKFTGGNGITIASGNSSGDLTIRNSLFEEILGQNDGGGAIYIRENDTQDNVLIQNVTFKNVGGSNVWTSSEGTNIRVGFGVHFDINDLTIADSYFEGISKTPIWVGSGLTNPIFERNTVLNFCQTINDCAGIYWGKDHPPTEPSIARRNYFRIDTQYTRNTSTVSGLYPDQSGAGIIMENNVMVNPGEYCFLCNKCNDVVYRFNSCILEDGWRKAKGIRISESDERNGPGGYKRPPAEEFEIYSNIIYNATDPLDDPEDQVIFENTYVPDRPPDIPWTYWDENVLYMPQRSASLCHRPGGQSCANSSYDYTRSQWCSNFDGDCNGFSNDPQYNDPANGDLTLRDTSPAIDNGTTEGCPIFGYISSCFPATDFDGNARPVGSGPDIGAYEYDGVPPDPPTAPPGRDGRGFDRGFERGDYR